MRLFLAIALLPLAALCACSLPEPNRPELQKEAAFPNLADVPPRPVTMSPAEREQILRELQHRNTELNAQ